MIEAQALNQQAIDKLCEQFKPLILKEARRESVFKSLGEDAISIAWTVFLGFIHRYNGTYYKHLPGLIQCHLRYELLHSVQKKGDTWDNEVIDFENSVSNDNVAYDPLQNLLLNMSLSQELKKLTKRQLEILWRYYFAKESHEAIGKALNCAARTIGYQRVQALKKLKVNILL